MYNIQYQVQILIFLCCLLLAGFAELNAEVEETYGEMMHQHLPYRDVPSYVYHSFFHEDSPAIVTESLGGFGRSRDVQQGLADFRRLLSDKKFLLTVIRTLEDKNSFDISNRWVWHVGVACGCGMWMDVEMCIINTYHMCLLCVFTVCSLYVFTMCVYCMCLLYVFTVCVYCVCLLCLLYVFAMCVYRMCLLCVSGVDLPLS